MDTVITSIFGNGQFYLLVKKISILLFCILLIKLILFHWDRRRLYIAGARFPGPISWPIVGNALLLKGNTDEILNTLTHLFEKYQPVFRLWLGPILVICIQKPKDIEIILNNRFTLEKGPLYNGLRHHVANGLLTAPVNHWRKHRKIIQPTFNQQVLNSFLPIFNAQSDILANKVLKNYEGKGSFDMFKLFSRFTLDSVCETMMGVQMNSQTGQSPYIECLTEYFEISFLRIVKIWLQIDFLFFKTKLGKKMMQVAEILIGITNKIVSNRRMELSEMKLSDTENNDTDKQRKTFIDYILTITDKNKAFTDQEIFEEVTTIIAGGNDTSASVLGFVMIMLGMHPEIQERTYQELKQVFGDGPVYVTSEHLSQVEYLERVIKETLRLFPVSPLLARYAESDINLGDYVVPKGASICYSIINNHRDPTNFPDPLNFDPDRFLPEEVAKRHPYAYIPFSAGVRNCIGLRYGMTTMKVVMAKIVLRYKISTPYKCVEDVKVKQDLVIKAANGYIVSIEERKNSKA